QARPRRHRLNRISRRTAAHLTARAIPPPRAHRLRSPRRLGSPVSAKRTDRVPGQPHRAEIATTAARSTFTHASVLRDPARRVMSMHIDACAARSAAPGAPPRLRLPRTAWWPAALLAVALAAAFATAAPTLAAQPGVTKVSADPYTPATASRGEHATEVEPDTFAFGSTVVSAFQAGRVFNGGATDIGWGPTSNRGASLAPGVLPAPSHPPVRPRPLPLS